jgi:hypothetical protein
MIPLFEEALRAQILGPRPRRTVIQPNLPEKDEFWESESKGEPVEAAEPEQEEEDPEAIALREQAAALLKQAKVKREAPKRDRLEYQFDQIAPKLRANHLGTLSDLAAEAERNAGSLSETHAERLREIARETADMPVRDAVQYLHDLREKYAGHPNTSALGKVLVQLQSAHRHSLARQNPSYRRRLEEIDLGWKKFHRLPKAKEPSPIPLNVLFGHAAAAASKAKK